MPVFATDQVRLSAVLKHEYKPSLGYCREMVTVNEAAAKTYQVGAVLGKVTATGKYKLVDTTASDGSQNAVAVVVGDKDGKAADVAIAATTDTKVQVVARGPVIVAAGGLQYAAGSDANAIAASLSTVGILVAPQL